MWHSLPKRKTLAKQFNYLGQQSGLKHHSKLLPPLLVCRTPWQLQFEAHAAGWSVKDMAITGLLVGYTNVDKLMKCEAPKIDTLCPKTMMNSNFNSNSTPQSHWQWKGVPGDRFEPWGPSAKLLLRHSVMQIEIIMKSTMARHSWQHWNFCRIDWWAVYGGGLYKNRGNLKNRQW